MSDYAVRSIMRREHPTAARSTPIRQAVSLILDNDAAALPVVAGDGGLEGILTQMDCFRPALHASYHQEWAGCVADYMTADVVTVDAGTDVVHAAEMFTKLRHRVLPVIEGSQFAGMLYRSDVLRLLLQNG